jgi:hypothetical protein
MTSGVIADEITVGLHEGVSHWFTVGARGPQRAAVIVAIQNQVPITLQNEVSFGVVRDELFVREELLASVKLRRHVDTPSESCPSVKCRRQHTGAAETRNNGLRLTSWTDD